MTHYPRVLTAALSQPWAICPQKLAEIRLFLNHIATGVAFEPVYTASDHAPFSQSAPGVAVIPIMGTLTPRANLITEYSGGASADLISRDFQTALTDPNVGAIVLQIDSPGGQVTGIPELADQIHAARDHDTRVIAQVDGMAASAAYWLAAQADEIVATPSSQVGSIGVYTLHEDHSQRLADEGITPTLISAGKYKTEGHPFGALDDDARAAIQAQVDDYYTLFIDAVARGRATDSASVRSGYGQGRTLLSAAALSAGMIDRIDTLTGTLTRLLGAAPRPAPTARSTPVSRLLRELDHLD